MYAQYIVDIVYSMCTELIFVTTKKKNEPKMIYCKPFESTSYVQISLFCFDSSST